MTNYKRSFKSGSSTRSYSGGRSGTSSYGKWWGGGSSYSTSSKFFGGSGGGSTTTPSFSWKPTQAAATRKQIKAKIGSYRTINQQFSSSGTTCSFSPTTAAKWIRFVNSGAFVYKFTTQEFCRCFGSKFNNCSATDAFRWLKKTYGTGVKAVCRGKANTWLVAASPSVTSGPFGRYDWNNS